jgi:hypothetical protein
VDSLPFVTRLWFAWICFFRVLFDGRFASVAWQLRERDAKGLPLLREAETAKTEAKSEAPEANKIEAKKTEVKAPPPPPPPADPALQLLSLFQREGRLVDFLEQDIASFSDADVGAAARVVHEGCRKTLRAHAKVAPVRSEDEGARVTIAAGFAPAEVKLSGNVQGAAPYTGVLRHRGWKATSLTLPTPVHGYDPAILAPAEVEL